MPIWNVSSWTYRCQRLYAFAIARTVIAVLERLPAKRRPGCMGRAFVEPEKRGTSDPIGDVLVAALASCLQGHGERRRRRGQHGFRSSNMGEVPPVHLRRYAMRYRIRVRLEQRIRITRRARWVRSPRF